jgi:hypothetical protein
MSAYLLESKHVSYKVLHGSDTDVSWCTYTRIGPDLFVEITYLDAENFSEKHVSHRVMTRLQMDELFRLQYGSPMMFISKEDYLKFVNTEE